MNSNISLKALLGQLAQIGRKLYPYTSFFIFLLLAAIYAFVTVRINAYSNPNVTEDEILTEIKTLPSPNIDDDAAAKLRSLQDNSVNVQVLFEEGRTNPFQE